MNTRTFSHRRSAYAALTAAVALAVPLLSMTRPACSGESYPSRPVRLVYPSAAGTTGDVRARQLAERLAARLGQPFMVENKPGANTTIGTAMVSQAKPDGYTLLVTFTPSFTIGPALYKSVTYDPVKSFTPVGTFGRGSPFLVVHPAVPVKTAAEFVAWAKKAPAPIAFGNGGAGGPNHLPAELFQRAAGFNAVHVSYKGESQALPDLLSGRVSAMFAYGAMIAPQIKGGTVKPLAYAGARRNPAFPDLPTVAEAGFPAFEYHGTLLILGPAGMPKAIASRLNAEIAVIIQEPQVRATFEAVGSEPFHLTIEDTAALIREDIENNATLVRQLGITLE